jgi:hypothetical protein
MVTGWNSESSKLIPHCLVLAPLVLFLDLIWRLRPFRLKILSTNLIILLATLFYPLRVKRMSLSRVSFSLLPKKNTELKHEITYLTAHFEKTKLSEKMIEEDLSQVEESATKSTYRLRVGFERYEKRMRIMLLSLFLAPATIKKRKHSNQPKPTTHPIQSQPSTQREK